MQNDSSAPKLDGQTECFLTEKQLAERHQLSVKTLRNARVYGGYVPFVKIGRCVRYRLSEVMADTREDSPILLTVRLPHGNRLELLHDFCR
jgi:hypothetical protein